MALSDIDMTKVKYYDYNNEVNIPKNGQIQLDKDKLALEDFIKNNVEPNTKRFSSLKERFQWLEENDYIEETFMNKYSEAFIEKLYDSILLWLLTSSMPNMPYGQMIKSTTLKTILIGSQ